MICNFIPDGSLTRMSQVGGTMDIKASAKGLNTAEGSQKKKQEGAGVNEAGEKSKGQANKEAAKAKKIAAKAAAKEGGGVAKAAPGTKPGLSDAAIAAKAAAAARANDPHAKGKKIDDAEATLGKQNFLGGQQPNQEDAEFYAELVKTNKIPNVNTAPHLFAWYYFVSKFTDAIKAGWAPSKKAQTEAKGADKKASAPAAPVMNPNASAADIAALEKVKAAIIQMKKDKADKTKIDLAVAELKRLKSICELPAGSAAPAQK